MIPAPQAWPIRTPKPPADLRDGLCATKFTRRHEVRMIKQGLPAIHPGEFLAEILQELGISQARFARVIGVSPMRVSHVVNGTRPVTAELALRFGRALGQSPQYWLNLQASYDLKTAESVMGDRLSDVVELVAA